MKIDTVARSLFFTTVRLVVSSGDEPDGYREGTGFIYNASRAPGTFIPILLTASHVVRGATEVEARFIKAGADLQPQLGEFFTMVMKDADGLEFTEHTSPDVDLCGTFCPAIAMLDRLGTPVYYCVIGASAYPTDEDLELLDAVEPVTFVGYPDGLYDRVNQTPIARQGTLATPVQWDYMGGPHFLIDANIFEGSSGSPVFHLQPAVRRAREGLAFYGGPCGIFLGLLTHKLDTRAEVLVEGAAKVEVRQGLNLGLVVRWTAIEELADEMCREAGIDRDAPAGLSAGAANGVAATEAAG